MSGSLIKIAETTVSSAVSSVTLTGIDSTFDVYMVTINNLDPDTNSQKFRIRFTVSGSADFCTFETVHRNGSNVFGMQGGGVLTVAQTCDGIQFFMESGNIELGTFKLYGLKK